MLCTTSDVDDVMFARRLSSVSSPMPVDKKMAHDNWEMVQDGDVVTWKLNHKL